MKKQIISLLQKQIDQLADPDFDLEAWKSAGIAVLSSIFGAEDNKVKQVTDLKIDYSSWTLRDSNANYKPVETCKKKGKAIFEAAIHELETFGPPAKKSEFLSDYFTAEEQKILLSESSDKANIITKLKKKDLENLVLKFLKESIV